MTYNAKKVYDIYSVSELYKADVSELAFNWQRRANNTSIILIPSGVVSKDSSREDLKKQLEFLNTLPGQKYILKDSSLYNKDVINYAKELKTINIIKNEVLRITIGDNKPGLVLIGFKNKPLNLKDNHYKEQVEIQQKLVKELHDKALDLASETKDFCILLTANSPFTDCVFRNDFVDLIEDLKIESVSYGNVEDQLHNTAYQGRCSYKNQYKAPDYRLGDALFLNNSITRIGTIDYAGWMRKDKERVPDISWTNSINEHKNFEIKQDLEIIISKTEQEYLYSELDNDIETADNKTEKIKDNKKKIKNDKYYDEFLEFLWEYKDGAYQSITKFKNLNGALYQKYRTYLEDYPQHLLLDEVLEYELDKDTQEKNPGFFKNITNAFKADDNKVDLNEFTSVVNKFQNNKVEHLNKELKKLLNKTIKQ